MCITIALYMQAKASFNILVNEANEKYNRQGKFLQSENLEEWHDLDAGKYGIL